MARVCEGELIHAPLLLLTYGVLGAVGNYRNEELGVCAQACRVTQNEYLQRMLGLCMDMTM